MRDREDSTARQEEPRPPGEEVRHVEMMFSADRDPIGRKHPAHGVQMRTPRETLAVDSPDSPRRARAMRLRRIVELIGEEADAHRPGRALILERLVEVLLVEALRFFAQRLRQERSRGLLAGLSDPALARTLREIHVDVARRWTVEQLARTAGTSRSVFAERFASSWIRRATRSRSSLVSARAKFSAETAARRAQVRTTRTRRRSRAGHDEILRSPGGQTDAHHHRSTWTRASGRG